jgi:CyaY protein
MTSAMTEAEFNDKAAGTILRLEEAIEASGADIDYETVSDILTLEFADRSKIIVNKQGAVRQLWVAARSGGFHYDYDAAGDCWRNDQSGEELFAELARLIAQQAGEQIVLK